jgi:HlyD family secretion protein
VNHCNVPCKPLRRARLLATLTLITLALAACRPDDPEHMSGTLERDRIDLVVESNEPITAIHVADGTHVSPGTLVLEQDPSRMQAQLQQAQAQREQAAARLAELQRGPRPELISEAQAQLGAARVVASNAQADYQRAEEMFERGLSNAFTRDHARTQRDNSAAQAQAQHEALAALLNGTTVEELQQAKAALHAAEAVVAQKALDVERTRVTAPASGTIDKVLYEQGERPAVGSTIAVLLDDSRVYARIYVPASLRSGVLPGSTLTVALEGVAETFQAQVSWVSDEASFTPYFALTEHDRSRLSYLAEVEMPQAAEMPTSLPLQAWLPAD